MMSFADKTALVCSDSGWAGVEKYHINEINKKFMVGRTQTPFDEKT